MTVIVNVLDPVCRLRENFKQENVKRTVGKTNRIHIVATDKFWIAIITRRYLT